MLDLYTSGKKCTLNLFQSALIFKMRLNLWLSPSRLCDDSLDYKYQCLQRNINNSPYSVFCLKTKSRILLLFYYSTLSVPMIRNAGVHSNQTFKQFQCVLTSSPLWYGVHNIDIILQAPSFYQIVYIW